MKSAPAVPSRELIQGQFRPYSGIVRGVAAFLTVVAPHHVLRVIVLADGDGPFLKVTDEVRAEDLRKSLHDESTLVGTVRISFEHSSDANNLVSSRY